MDPKYEPHWTNYLKQFDLPAEVFADIPITTEKYCVIVEPRRHPLLILVIKNFMYLLKKHGWGLIIFHGTENGDYIREGLAEWNPASYKMIGLGVSNLTIGQYNALMKSPAFWSTLKREGCKHALTFETDALLLKDNVDDFLEWDYVGAPWRQPECRWFGCLEVGNGGLCLRNVESMYQIVAIQKFQFGCQPHDGYFSMACLRLGYKVPSIACATTFAVESIYHPSPCGLHKPWLHVFPDGEYARMLAVRHVG
jgi:hypothetical protein